MSVSSNSIALFFLNFALKNRIRNVLLTPFVYAMKGWGGLVGGLLENIKIMRDK